MTNPRTDIAQGRSLRTWLVMANALILVVMIIASVGLAWQNGDAAVDDLAGQIQRRAGAQVEAHLQAYLADPHVVAQLMSDAVDLGELRLADPDGIYRYLYRLLRLYPGLSYLNIATEDGRFFGVGRVDNHSGAIVFEETHPPDLNTLFQYAIGEGGGRGPLLRELPFSDHRSQVWYREPRVRDAPVWSSIYSWVDNPEVVVASAGRPIHGAVEGVAGVDMFLASISEYLATLHISPEARVFIVERDGMLVASSLGVAPFRPSPEGSVRISALQAGDDPIARALEQIAERPGGLAAIHETIAFEFGLPERWFVTAQPWVDARGLDWVIVVTMPEADFGATIVSNSRRAALLGAGLLLAALLASLLVAQRLLRPLHEIERTARAITAGELSARAPRSRFSEVNRLAQAFDTMTERLAGAQAVLEQEVERRTAELQGVNAELERLSREDSLTGIANRRCFDPRLREEWLRARRAGEELSLVVCDIDHFKAYNDRYGHSAGDTALRNVATVLATNLKRPGDLAARYGGEEFVLLLPGTSAVDAITVAAEIREHVHELAILHESSPQGCVTLSFGVATHTPEQAFAAPELLFKAADQALYRAKELGRDRIEAAAPIAAPN